MQESDRNYKATIENIQAYLEGSAAHGQVERTLHDRDWAGFLCSFLSVQNQFILCFRVDEALHMLMIDVYPDLLVREDMLDRAALWCIEETAKQMVGHLRLDRESRRIYARTESSFHDGPVSTETVARLEQFALSLLLLGYEELSLLGETKHDHQ